MNRPWASMGGLRQVLVSLRGFFLPTWPRAVDSRRIRQQILAEQMRWVYQNGRNSIYFNPLLALILCVGYWSELNWWLPTMTVAMCLVSLGRLRLLQQYLNASDEQRAQGNWATRYVYGCFASGVTWGIMSSILALQLQSDAYYVIICLVVGLSGAGTITLMAHLPSVWAMFFPTLLPSLLVCLTRDDRGLSLATGIMMVFFIVLMIRLSRINHLSLIEGLIYRFENVDLAERLAEANRQLSSHNQELAQTNQQLSHLSSTDALTQLANRREFDLRLSLAWRAMQQHQTALGLILIDVDHFKAFNDRYGHQAGDDCLRKIAAAIASACRQTDLAARYGGEEFAIIAQTDSHGMGLLLERVRQQVIRQRIPAASEQTHNYVTVSLGGALVYQPPSPDWTVEHLIELADRALYQSKRMGRNRSLLLPLRADP